MIHQLTCKIKRKSADPGFVRQYLGVSLTRKGAAFLHALQTLAAAEGVDLSFSLVYQGREEPLAELSPQHQYLLLHISQRAAVPPRVQVCCHPAGG